MKRFWLLVRLALVASFAMVGVALLMLGVNIPTLGWLMLAFATYKRMKRRRWGGRGTYGTAVLGDMRLAARQGWLSNRHGLVIGRAGFMVPPKRGQSLRMLMSPSMDSRLAVRLFHVAFFRRGGDGLLRIHNYTHLAVFAATGAGKGIGYLLPILLSHVGSCICTDPKAENFLLTSARRKSMGHRVLILDPFKISGQTGDSWNILDGVDDTAANFAESAMVIAEALIVTSEREMQPHFPASGKIILQAIICYVCACADSYELRNLQMVRHILSSPSRFQQTITLMQQVKTHGGLIARMGDTLTWYHDKELHSILTTITRFTAWLDTPAMQAITTSSTFDPSRFKSEPHTLFLVLPPEYLETHAPLMRMWISTLLSVLSQGPADEKRQVLFLLDEASHLGKIPILTNAVSLMRGYGIRLFFFFQSIGQVKEIYGDHALTFLDNIGTQIYFGVNAYESGEAISKRCGDATELVETLNKSDSYSRPLGGFSSKDQSRSTSTSRGINTAEVGRPLFRPDEVLRLNSEVALMFHMNLPVFPIKLLKYYEDPEFRRFDARVPGIRVWDAATLLDRLVIGCALLLCLASMLQWLPGIQRAVLPPTPPPVMHSYTIPADSGVVADTRPQAPRPNTYGYGRGRPWPPGLVDSTPNKQPPTYRFGK
jgi:type IV secretion system protein VirD4